MGWGWGERVRVGVGVGVRDGVGQVGWGPDRSREAHH